MTGGDKITFTAQPGELLPTMDHKNIRIAGESLTGGYGGGLREAIRVLQKPHPDRFIVFTEPTWAKAASADYPKFQADQIETAHQDGARGLKVRWGALVASICVTSRAFWGNADWSRSTIRASTRCGKPWVCAKDARGHPRARAHVGSSRLLSAHRPLQQSVGKNCTIIPTGHSMVRIFRPTASFRKPCRG